MSTVYNLESIISEEDMEYLDSLANKLILKADELSQLDDRVSLSQYFKEEITKSIQSSKLNEKRKLVLVKALLYTECLIQLASAGKSIPPGLNHLCPGGLDKRVIKIFSLVERYGYLFYVFSAFNAYLKYFALDYYASINFDLNFK